MCAIVDASVGIEVFGTNRPPAGKKFFDWLNTGPGRMVVGGKLRKELGGLRAYRGWAQVAQLSGRIRNVSDREVDQRTAQLSGRGVLKSNDPHVIALAQVSGARLLYSNDGDLQSDFKDRRLIRNPRGKVYSTVRTKKFTQSRREQLVDRRELCRSDL